VVLYALSVVLCCLNAQIERTVTYISFLLKGLISGMTRPVVEVLARVTALGEFQCCLHGCYHSLLLAKNGSKEWSATETRWLICPLIFAGCSRVALLSLRAAVSGLNRWTHRPSMAHAPRRRSASLSRCRVFMYTSNHSVQ
jgi:hypothetical protein